MALVDPALEQAPVVDQRTSGEVLDGRYRLVHRIGRGGFGDVWRAEELLPDGAPFRDVALKLLLASLGDATDWAEEAKLLASFRHPSLATIYAAGILGTAPALRFVAMELLEGQNLSDLLRARGQIPWRRVLRWACSAAAALDVIHLHGVVHLDLKPANLFLCSDGALKVLDFGIARRAGARKGTGRRQDQGTRDGSKLPRGAATLIAGSPAHEDAYAATLGVFAATRPMREPGVPVALVPPGVRAGPTFIHVDRARGTATLAPADSDGQTVIGTPGFMAPEVLELAQPTAAADAYALAVCVVQLITGQLPHAAADEPSAWDDPTAVSEWLDAIRRATLRGDKRDFAADPATCPRGLAALLHRLLEVDPRARGVTAGKLGELFEEVWQRPHGTPDPPYLGLSAFPPEAEGVLFGRDDDIGRLGRELEFAPAVVLQGVRGSGKSSLASAGLVPFLALRGADGKDDWAAVRVAPGLDPDAALARALARVAPRLEGASFAELAAHAGASPVGLVLLVDPLEEVLAAPPDRSARIAALLTAIAERAITPGLRLIATLGEEHTAALLAAAPLGSALRASLRFVEAPSVAAVADIVGGPAHFAGVTVIGIEGIVAEVQRELRAGAFRLPYVALALRAWWECGVSAEPAEGPADAPRARPRPAEASKRKLTGARFRELGGVPGALAQHAARVIDGLRGEERPLADEILLRLSATDGTPLRWSEAELLDTLGEGEERARAAEVLDALVRAHLLRRQGGAVEIGHPALLTGFSHLTSARLHHMDRLLRLERVRHAVEAWERADHHPAFLLHGALLVELMVHRRSALRGLSPRERAFVAESWRRERWQRLKKVVGLIAVAFTLAFAFGAKWMLESARTAEANARAEKLELERTAELVARSRRTEDPYARAAYLVAAMERGSQDGMLPLDLGSVAAGAVRADRITLDHVSSASFPWDDRWLVGQRSGDTLILVDFHPAEPDLIEDIDFDLDLEAQASAHFRMPEITEIRPHEDPIVERLAFAFDTSIVTRSATGEVKVIRLRRDGTAAVAATAPFRCAGAMHLAEAAPVLACAAGEGIVRWDLRKARQDPAAREAVARHPFVGAVAALSADGARVAAIEDNRALLWAPDEQREVVFTAEAPISLARWSPRDEVLALIEEHGFEVVDFSKGAAPSARPLVREGAIGAPVSARWDEGGLDLGVCEASGAGRWFYLKSGGRAKEDAPPRGSPCAEPRPVGQPPQLSTAADIEELAGKALGPDYSPLGGFRLRGHRYLTPGLVILNAEDPAASRLLRFQGREGIGGEEAPSPGASVVAVERDEGVAFFQIGDELRLYALPEGHRLLSRKGHLLRRCSDGRQSGWIAEEDSYQVFDVRTGGVIGVAPRAPGLVIGTDSGCKVLYTQRLDGALIETTLSPDGKGSARVLAVADGYVFDARPSPARDAVGPGMWLALSSGAIARIDELRHAARLVGYATPRAAAIAEGPRAGEIAYIDATGVIVQDLAGKTERVLEQGGESAWEDLSVAPGNPGATMLLASADRIAAVDLARHEILGSIPVNGKGRLSAWDDEGSVIAWSFDRAGGAEGQVIPRGKALAQKVAAAISNLTVENGKLVLSR